MSGQEEGDDVEAIAVSTTINGDDVEFLLPV